MHTLVLTSDKLTDVSICNRKAVLASKSFPFIGYLISTKAGLQREHVLVPSKLTPCQGYFVLIRQLGSSSLKALRCFSQLESNKIRAYLIDISILDKNRCYSIEIDTNQSINIGNR